MDVDEDVGKKFAEYIKLQLLDEKFLAREREKKILAEGVTRFEIALEEARLILMDVAAELDLIFEKDVDKLVKEMMHAFSATDGYIGSNEFQHAVNFYRQLSSGHVMELDAKRRLKQMMIDHDWKPRRKGLAILNAIGTTKWFSEIPG